MQSPLPVRDGVNATRLRLPQDGPLDTVLDYVMERFGHVDPEGIFRRFEDGEIVGIDGTALTRRTPLGEHVFMWYYRNLPAEERIPFELEILHQDENLLVVDKPHFLPTTPGGIYVQESALVRLRVQLQLPELIPMHRLDRMTAGILLFSTNPATRGAYQSMFERRTIDKVYECVAPLSDELGFPRVVRNRMIKSRTYLLAEVIDGEPNAETRIELLHSGRRPDGTGIGHYRLEPHTGKTHQLRVHMASLGLGILNDPFYPELLDKAPDDYTKPLQLLARRIGFTDPLSGQYVQYSSGLELSERPTG